ncbi:MAG: hypothetical protein NVS2B12_17640 [Ktedonobacteraceae bacterium]
MFELNEQELAQVAGGHGHTITTTHAHGNGSAGADTGEAHSHSHAYSKTTHDYTKSYAWNNSDASGTNAGASSTAFTDASSIYGYQG